ncbi:hypothetical protein AHiyo8_09700 [Arthrobacter sp. Hiyo8]|nr:hypothetical protein AHiyo8_09700 [Arthrobacter sp. Hiyo8]
MLGVRGLGLVVDCLRGERGPGRLSRQSGLHGEVESDGGGLVDDHDPVPVRELDDFLGVGVVGGAERVCAGPVKEAEVVDEVGVVVAFAADGGVLVLAEAGEVERLAVDEELFALDGDRADPDGSS